MLAKQGRDFVALNLPEEVSEASPAHSQAPHAIFTGVDGGVNADR